jgi:hypothetical protein
MHVLDGLGLEALAAPAAANGKLGVETTKVGRRELLQPDAPPGWRPTPSWSPNGAPSCKSWAGGTERTPGQSSWTRRPTWSPPSGRCPPSAGRRRPGARRSAKWTATGAPGASTRPGRRSMKSAATERKNTRNMLVRHRSRIARPARPVGAAGRAAAGSMRASGRARLGAAGAAADRGSSSAAHLAGGPNHHRAVPREDPQPRRPRAGGRLKACPTLTMRACLSHWPRRSATGPQGRGRRRGG